MNPSAAFALAGIVVAGMLVRPWRSHEWQWAAGGAFAAIALRVEPPAAAWHAAASGGTVYALLAGIALLSETGRRGGVFALVASLARRAAGRSQSRLFALLFGAGVAITALLSNDTTALVLTPAVLAALDGSGVEALPYLYSCAFVANAASFVFPFSNPANVLTFGGHPLPLGAWMAVFGAAAGAAVVATYAALVWRFAWPLREPLAPAPAQGGVDARTGRTLIALAVATLGMLGAAAAGWNIGVATLLLASGAFTWSALAGRPTLGESLRRMPWEIFPLVGGLLIVVDALDRSGGLAPARQLFTQAATLSPMLGAAAAALATGVACLLNNLPVAVAVAFAHGHAADARLLHASAIGVDLGPNLFLSGSLSTLLWAVALRREGIEIRAGSFFLTGLIAGLPALIVAALLVR